MDTVCRLYEVGRQRLAEEEEDEEDQVRLMQTTYLKIQLFLICFFSFSEDKMHKCLGHMMDIFNRYVNDSCVCIFGGDFCQNEPFWELSVVCFCDL